MLCKLCHNELAISASFTSAERDKNGATKIYSVVDLKCTDENCPDGKRGAPVARLKRLIENSSADESAVSCCGIPLVYLTESGYWVPDEGLMTAESDSELVLLCPSCSKRVVVNVSGKEKL